MKHYFLLCLCILSLQSSFAQQWKKDAKPFAISQDDDQKELLKLSVPAKCTLGTGYALYEQGKNVLNISGDLDDSPELTVRRSVKDKTVDLLKYSAEVPDKVLAGSSDFSISNKTVSGKVISINGIQSTMINYDYTHTISGANITEKGRVMMYIINVSGTSLINAEEHPIIVRLKFDIQQNDGDALDKLALEIARTVVKVN